MVEIQYLQYHLQGKEKPKIKKIYLLVAAGAYAGGIGGSNPYPEPERML